VVVLLQLPMIEIYHTSKTYGFLHELESILCILILTLAKCSVTLTFLPLDLDFFLFQLIGWIVMVRRRELPMGWLSSFRPGWIILLHIWISIRGRSWLSKLTIFINFLRLNAPWHELVSNCRLLGGFFKWIGWTPRFSRIFVVCLSYVHYFRRSLCEVIWFLCSPHISTSFKLTWSFN